MRVGGMKKCAKKTGKVISDGRYVNITRQWAYPICYRMDLKKARSRNKAQDEKRKFLNFIDNFKQRPKAVITDSQAMDIVPRWLAKDAALTTFSIAMINYFSRGKLSLFVQGISALDKLKSGDRVLIVEACNHSRIAEDIGTVQIPRYFEKNFSKSLAF